MKYKTTGVCCSEIDIEVENEIIKSLKFKNGCAGNTAGIAKLVIGMRVDEVIKKLEGTTCGFRATSCPDQLAKALKSLKE